MADAPSPRRIQRKRTKEPRAPAVTSTSLKVGDMVAAPDGTVGLLVGISPTRQLGALVMTAPGITVELDWRGLRHAAWQEIVDAGLDGVGCNQWVPR